MQFPMNRTDRLALTAIADDLAALERRAADLGLDFLALIVSQAREEASSICRTTSRRGQSSAIRSISHRSRAPPRRARTNDWRRRDLGRSHLIHYDL